MSVQAISWALQIETGNATEKLVLMTLAHHSNETNDNRCWPSQETLLRETEIKSKTTIKKAIRSLEEKNLITVLRRGHRKTNIYRLNFKVQYESIPPTPDELADLEADPFGVSKCDEDVFDDEPSGSAGDPIHDVKGQQVTPIGSANDPRIVKNSKQDKNSKGYVVQPTPAPPQNDPQPTHGFSEWWSQYPIKRNKKKALGIWKRKRLAEKSDLLIADVIKRKESDKQWRDGYIPHPTTYLNGERWEDELTGYSPQQVSKAKQEHERLVQANREAMRRALERQ